MLAATLAGRRTKEAAVSGVPVLQCSTSLQTSLATNQRANTSAVSRQRHLSVAVATVSDYA